MGIIYLALLIIGFAESNALSGEKGSNTYIPLPPTPKQIAPPTPNSNDVLGDDLRRKRQNRKKVEKKSKKPPIPPEKKRNDELLKESQKPRPMDFFAEVSFAMPHITTSGNRKNYIAELTSHFQVAWRLESEKPITERSLFLGLRVAPFAGTGIYDGVPGRYGFVYFGPMIGLGKIDPPSRKEGSGRSARTKESNIKLESRSGWLLSTGIAAQTRNGKVDSSSKTVDDDFNSKGVAFDSPGVWAEARYLQLHFGAVSISYILGVQTGRNKTFYWLGIGGGGWH